MSSTSIYFCLIQENCIQNKYTKWYLNICANAQRRIKSTTLIKGRKEAKGLLSYTEAHHIWPKCLCTNKESINDFKNHAFLTAKEHFIVHLLLCKMFDGQIKYKMYNAIGRFIQINDTQTGNRSISSRNYQQIRQFISEANSRPSPMKGKKIEEYTKDPLGTKEKMSVIKRGKRPANYDLFIRHAKDKTYVTNNIIEVRVFTDSIPPGFVIGRLRLTCGVCGYSADSGNFNRYHKNKH